MMAILTWWNIAQVLGWITLPVQATILALKEVGEVLSDIKNFLSAASGKPV